MFNRYVAIISRGQVSEMNSGVSHKILQFFSQQQSPKAFPKRDLEVQRFVKIP